MSPVKRGKIGRPNWQNWLARSNLMLRLARLKKARGEEICKEDKFYSNLDSFLFVPSFTKLSLILMLIREKHQANTFLNILRSDQKTPGFIHFLILQNISKFRRYCAESFKIMTLRGLQLLVFCFKGKLLIAVWLTKQSKLLLPMILICQ